MPTFEHVIILKQMSDAALKAVLKRSAGYIFEVGATLRKMENLGVRNLPFRMRSQGAVQKVGHFFVFSYDCALDKPLIVKNKFKLDHDIMRASFWQRYADPIQMHTKEKTECTLHVDLLPPPYRPNVIALQQLIEEKKQRKKDHSRKNYEDSDFFVY